MPAYGDVRQQVILALESQGADALTILIQALEELKDKQTALTGEFAAGERTAAEYIKRMRSLDAEIKKLQGSFKDAGNEFSTMTELQKALGAMERKTASDSVEAARATADARRAGTQAVVDHIAKVREESAAIEAARVAEIKAMGDRAQAYARAERAAEQERASHVQTTAATRQQIDGLKELGIIKDKDVVATGKGMDSAKAYRGSLMSVAYALDDVRYGFGAIVNNIPMLAMASGVTSQWAAGIAIAGIGVYELGKALGPVANQFARDWGIMEDSTKKFVSSVDDLKAKLEALKAKPVKLEIDYREIEAAERLLDVMQERLNAFNAGRKDNLTEEAAKQAKDATHSYSGGTEALQKAVYDTDRARGFSRADQNLTDQLKAERKLLQEIKDFGSSDPMAGTRAQENIDRLGHDVDVQERARTADEVGAFQTGDFQAIQRMQDRAKKFPGAFGRVGPGGVTSAEAIANLPSTPQETLRRIDEEEDQKLRDEKERDTSRNFKEGRRKQREAKRKAEQAEVENIRHEQRMKDKERKDAEAENLWQMQQNDRIKREGEQAGRKDDSAKMRAMRSIAQSNQRRSRETDPVKTGKAQDAAANKEERGARADVATFKKNLADAVTLGQITRRQEAEILQANGLAVEAAKVMEQIKGGVMAGRARRPRFPTRSPHINR